MPVRCREVEQRLPQSPTSGGFMTRAQREEPTESSLASHLQSVPLNPICMLCLFVFFVFTDGAMIRRERERERDEGKMTPPPWGEDEVRWNHFSAHQWFHLSRHRSAICWPGGAGQLVLWIRPPQSKERLLPNTRVSPSPLSPHPNTRIWPLSPHRLGWQRAAQRMFQSECFVLSGWNGDR